MCVCVCVCVSDVQLCVCVCVSVMFSCVCVSVSVMFSCVCVLVSGAGPSPGFRGCRGQPSVQTHRTVSGYHLVCVCVCVCVCMSTYALYRIAGNFDGLLLPKYLAVLNLAMAS